MVAEVQTLASPSVRSTACAARLLALLATSVSPLLLSLQRAQHFMTGSYQQNFCSMDELCNGPFSHWVEYNFGKSVLV